MQELPDVVEELLPDRLVQSELMAKVCEPLGRDGVLADPHLHRIARNEADRDEGEEHQRQERRDRQRDPAEKIGEHGRLDGVGRRPRAAPDQPY